MTKSHGLHRKKAIHLKFKRSARVRRLFYRVSAIFDRIKASRRREVCEK